MSLLLLCVADLKYPNVTHNIQPADNTKKYVLKRPLPFQPPTITHTKANIHLVESHHPFAHIVLIERLLGRHLGPVNVLVVVE
jgi:hypothetical protein